MQINCVGHPTEYFLKGRLRLLGQLRAFLAKVGEGRIVLAFRKNEIAFSQGDVADKVFYIQKGKVKVVVLSEQGREAVVGIFEPRQFFARGSLRLRSGDRAACWKKSARPGAGVIKSAHSTCRADAQVVFDSNI